MSDNTSNCSSVEGTLSIRISDIPSTINLYELNRILEGLTVNQNSNTSSAIQEGIDRSKPTRIRPNNIKRISLSPSLPSLFSPRFQVAVVSFRYMPAELESLTTNSGTLDICLTVHSGGDQFQMTFDKHFHGLTPLNNPPTPSIDVIAVTGLAGHAFGSWKGRRSSTMWLQDFLPDDLQHQGYHARVLTYGYDTKLVESTSTATMHDISQQFLNALKCARGKPEESRRPIIFIGHSLGGLVIKQALTHAEFNISDNKNQDILKSCYAILFFGVPNKGLQPSQLTTMVEGQPNDHLVRDLVGESQYLQLLDQACSSFPRKEGTRVISFYEQRQTHTILKNINTGKWERRGPSILMVAPESAIHSVTNGRIDSIPLDADHTGLVKFSSRSDRKYETILEKLLEIVGAAQQVVNDRFATLYSGRKCEKSTILGWLLELSKKHEFRRTYTKHISKRFENTGSWFLAEDRFRNWKASNESSLLWCHGMPGAGKTVLLSLVLQKLEQEFGPSSNTGITFIYCDYTSDLDPLTYLAIFIKQLCRQTDDIPAELGHLHHKHTSNFTEPEFNELLGVFIALSRCFNRVFLLLDALDECPTNTRKALIKFFKGIVSCNHIKLFIASRKDPEIDRGFQDFPKIEIEAKKVGADIKAYVTSELETISVRDGSLKEEILKTILGQADAMFLWVNFQLEHIRNQISDNGIEMALKSLPEDMDQTYERIIRFINDKPEPQRTLARRVLMWVAYAQVPLVVEELVCAVAMENHTRSDRQLCRSMVTEREMVLDVCANLVVFEYIDLDSPTVRFIHFSVREFLLQSSLKPADFPAVSTLNIGRESAHAEIAQLCITFILFCKVQIDSDMYFYHNFMISAETIWGYHVRSLTKVSEALMEIILELFKFGAFLEWCSRVQPSEYNHVVYTHTKNTRFSPFTVALIFDLPLVFKHLEIHHDKQGNYPDDAYAMHHAARESSCNAIKRLCDQGFSVHKLDQDGCTPLYYANSKLACQLLLDNGAVVSAPGGKGGSTLQAAASKGRTGIVKFLLDRGADVNAQGGKYGGALQAAARTKELELVQLLLDSGADVNAKGGRFGNALQAAVTRGTIAMVLLLLERGADVNAQGGRLGSALEAAAYGGNMNVAQVLLERGADVNTQAGEEGGPLQAAASNGMLDLVQILLDRGVDVNAEGGTYGSALQAAARNGKINVVQLLLERGADVNAQGGLYGNALQAAACGGKVDLVQLLLQKGADVNAQGGCYGNSLQAAATRGDIELVQVLLEGGADVNTGGALRERVTGRRP